jgi:hypothetical protein
VTKPRPLQARLHIVNEAISDQQQARDSAPRGSAARKRAKRSLRRLHTQRRRLRRDRWKMRGATAIIKYEVIPILAAAGVPITSRKRWNPFGNRSSDHFLGNRDADAADGATHADNNQLGSEVASALKNRKTQMRGSVEFTITRKHTGSEETYRVQIITEEHGTGPHIHNGVKRIS